MKRFTIKRIAENRDNTYGVFIDGDTPFAVTLELPWRHNIQNVSCIFPGVYICKKRTWGRYNGYWELQNVGGRTAIIIHWGIVNEHTLGCILVGEMFEKFIYKKRWWSGILPVKSERGTIELMEKTKDLTEFELEIIDCTGKV